ncbi:recombinase family protein [Paenibacillus azoreducens]|uniref:recombinase family protein n=1 Tax=Paenibacillus azoreducens TaxID=116718 RepID=UPI0039F48668
MRTAGNAKNGHFQQVVRLRLNRLSRKLSDLLRIVQVFNKQGIALRSLTEDF